MGATFGRVTLGSDEPLSEEVLGQTPGFTSRQEIREVMRDPRYRQDPAYRAIVERAIRNTDPSILGTLPDNEAQEQRHKGLDLLNGESLQAKRELIQQRFNNPKYKTSALFRQETARLIAENNKDQAGHEGTNRVGLSTENGKVGGLVNTGVYRVTFPTQLSDANKPEPKPKAEPKDSNVVDLGY